MGIYFDKDELNLPRYNIMQLKQNKHRYHNGAVELDWGFEIQKLGVFLNIGIMIKYFLF